MKTADMFAAVAVMIGCTLVVSKVIAPKVDGETAAGTEESANPGQSVNAATSAPAAPAPAANAALLKLEDDGHYWANAEVDGRAIEFMVDTGASTVALTYRDARRIGLDPDALDYSWRIRTAGGEVMGASVQLSSIRIGRIQVENVEAMVLRDGLSQSLLGMTFLRELESYEFRRGNLILRQ